MLLGYARVSKSDGSQSLDQQLDMLEKAGCQKVFSDKASGMKQDRPGQDDLMKHVREGDTIMVTAVDRIGRSMKHLINFLCDLDDLGVNIIAITQGIDTTTENGKTFYYQASIFADSERRYVSERTKSALTMRKKNGVYVGRKPKMTMKDLLYAERCLRERTHYATEVAAVLGVTRATLCRYINADGFFTQRSADLFGLKN